MNREVCEHGNTTEKPLSAWELLRELKESAQFLERLFNYVSFIENDKELKTYYKMLWYFLDEKNEQEAIKIMLEIKQELEENE